VVKSYNLEKELAEMDSLQKESDEHDTLHITVGVVYDNLELAPTQEMSSLAVPTPRITDRACKIVRDALRLGVCRSFAIARSHYENMNLAMMSQGFAPGYSDTELEQIEDEMVSLA
jgi:hypothetical protein